MIGGILFLQSATVFNAGSFGAMILSWQQAGLFSYIIPFLLIFSLVFGILSRMNLFKENKAVTAIIALAVGLMALQLDIVPKFFSQIFPRFGVAISIILVILIVLGLFVDPKKPWIMYILLGVAAIIVVVVLVQSAGALGISSIGQWIQDNWEGTIGVIVIAGGVIGAIAAIISSGRQRRVQEYHPLAFFPMEGGK